MRNEKHANGLKDLVKSLSGDNLVIVEIGSYAGESADIFASFDNVKTIWCIDPWLPGWDSKAKASSSDYKEVEAAFDRVMEKHPSKINKFKGDVI